jgi:hypothetical protein
MRHLMYKIMFSIINGFCCFNISGKNVLRQFTVAEVLPLRSAVAVEEVPDPDAVVVWAAAGASVEVPAGPAGHFGVARWMMWARELDLEGLEKLEDQYFSSFLVPSNRIQPLKFNDWGKRFQKT